MKTLSQNTKKVMLYSVMRRLVQVMAASTIAKMHVKLRGCMVTRLKRPIGLACTVHRMINRHTLEKLRDNLFAKIVSENNFYKLRPNYREVVN